MTDQTPAACAERPPYREFAIPCLRSRQEQIREVGADNEQDEGDSSLQYPDRTADTAEDLVTHGLHLEDVAIIPARRREHMPLGHAHTLAPILKQSVQFLLGRLYRDSILQSSNQVEEMTGAILTIARVQPEWQP